MLDSEKLDMRNQLERIKLNYDDLTRRYNDLSTEAQSRVRLQEHLSQTGELKRYIIILFRLYYRVVENLDLRNFQHFRDFQLQTNLISFLMYFCLEINLMY